MKSIVAPSLRPVRPLILMLLWVWLAASPASATAQEVRVDGPPALQAALADSPGGTIVLADGNYGELEVMRDFPAPVILRAETLHGARFSVIRLVGASNITLQGLQIAEGLAIKTGAADVAVHQSRITGNVYVRDAARLTFADNEVTGGQWGVLLNSVAGFSLTRNHIHRAGEDLMRITGNSFDGLVEGNIIADTVAKRPLHPDIIQFFHANGQAPHDIVIRRNLLHDPGVKGNVSAQGIFVSDPGRGPQNKGYQNILIEENLINTAATNTIFINSGHSSVRIRNNTLIARDGGGGNIRLIGKAFGDGGPRVEGNVFKSLIDKEGLARMGQNLVYKGTAEARMFSGGGARWQDYQPVLGTEFDRSGLGAAAFLADLQAAQKPGVGGPLLLGPSWTR